MNRILGSLGVDIQRSAGRGDQLLMQPGLHSCEFGLGLDIKDFAELGEQWGGHRLRLGLAGSGGWGEMDFGEFKGVEPGDAFGLEVSVKRGGSGWSVVGVAVSQAGTKEITPRDRCDEGLCSEVDRGHAKGSCEPSACNEISPRVRKYLASCGPWRDEPNMVGHIPIPTVRAEAFMQHHPMRIITHHAHR